MPARPSIAVKRPNRVQAAITAPTPIAQTAIPAIDPDSSDARAFSLRGRANPGSDEQEGRAVDWTHQPPPIITDRPPDLPPDTRRSTDHPSDQHDASYSEETPSLISIKLPPDVGRQLAAIADRRGSKRTLIAIEALSEPLRALAAAHRAGDFPELPKIVSGTVRSSIAFALPSDLASDLDFVLRTRRAVRAQVVTRLLTPAVRALYDSEVGRRSR